MVHLEDSNSLGKNPGMIRVLRKKNRDTDQAHDQYKIAILGRSHKIYAEWLEIKHDQHKTHAYQTDCAKVVLEIIIKGIWLIEVFKHFNCFQLQSYDL